MNRSHDDEPRVAIVLDREDRIYRPGTPLRGEFRLMSGGPLRLERGEISVGWYTEGQGDTDEHAVYQADIAVGATLQLGRSLRFEAPLPRSPWSYDGHLVKIRWAVRVILHPERGRRLGFEEAFRLVPEAVEAAA